MFTKELASLEKRMLEMIQTNDELQRNYDLLRTIPGIGSRAAVGLLAEAGDLRSYASAQQLAASFGLNPMIRRSGTSIKGQTRISKIGNAHARKRFYLPALVATKHNPTIKRFHDRLIAAGKHKKAVIVACERKLVMIAYGVLISQKPFTTEALLLTN